MSGGKQIARNVNTSNTQAKFDSGSKVQGANKKQSSLAGKQSSTRTTAKKPMKNQGQKFLKPEVIQELIDIDLEYASEMNDFVRVRLTSSKTSSLKRWANVYSPGSHFM